MKHILDFEVIDIQRLHEQYALLRLSPASGQRLPEGIAPGQFVQVRVLDTNGTFLRRPISINMVDYENNELWLLVRNAGAATDWMVNSKPGDLYNIIFPLGRGFSLPSDKGARILLVGGGVGVAPLLYYGKVLKEHGLQPEFALGARTRDDLLMVGEFESYGPVHLSTEDGSKGQRGFITQNSVFDSRIDFIACCGPTPMMKAVAKIASAKGIECEVSLENMMACGIGACLCCVENTKEGNLCVCTEGPVFNINRLKW